MTGIPHAWRCGRLKYSNLEITGLSANCVAYLPKKGEFLWLYVKKQSIYHSPFCYAHLSL